MALKLKQHDLRPWLVAVLQQSDTTPIDLTDAESVTVKVRKQQTPTPKVDAACEVLDAEAGQVRYKWTGTDTDTVGTYDVEWEIDWEAGAGVDPQTVPTEGYYTVEIADDLDSP